MYERYKEFIDRINEDGIEETCEHFGFIHYGRNDYKVIDTDKLFKIMDKHKLWGYIGLDNIEDNYIMDVAAKVVEYNQDYVIDFVYMTLDDVTKEDNNYYYNAINLDEMAEWFSEGDRNGNPRDIASTILGDDYNDFGYDYFGGNNYMGDIYDELTEQNRKNLRDEILERYKDQEIAISDRYASDIFRNISEENEDEDFVLKLSSENIMDLFSCDETMNYLFDNDFASEGGNLVNIYNNAYENALYNQNYRKVIRELCGTFIDNDNCEEFYDEKTKEKIFHFKIKEGKRENLSVSKLKITDVFTKNVIAYLNDSRCENIFSLGSYNYIIIEGTQCAWEELSFSPADYVSDLKKEINYSFNDYFL